MMNVWAPVGATYHRLAVDRPGLVVSFCNLPIATHDRYVVDNAAGFDATPVIGDECAMCRALSIYGRLP